MSTAIADQPLSSAQLAQRFPFRDRGEADRDLISVEVSRAMTSIENMLYRLTWQQFGKGGDHDDVSEVVQRCRIWLWQRSMPKYDSDFKSKITTFLYACANNFIRQEVRAILRRRLSTRHISSVDPVLIDAYHLAPDEHLDDKIEAAADDVLARPGKYLTKTQVRVFRAIVDQPPDTEIMMKKLAVRLGYKRQSSLSTMLARIRERILAIDIESFEPQEC